MLLRLPKPKGSELPIHCPATYTHISGNDRQYKTFNRQRAAHCLRGQTFNPNTGAISGTGKSGNPISHSSGDTRRNFTWQNGRQLATATSTEGNTETSISYSCDLNGLRTEKTVTTKTYAVVQR